MVIRQQILATLALLGACSSGGGAGPGAGPGDDATGKLTISGRAHAARAEVAGAVAAGARTITHVMAVNPESASAERVLAKVGADGSFELGLALGKPYVLVFIDGTAIGGDMAVGMFRAGTLDTVSPQLAGHLDLGEVMVEPSVQTAAIGISYDDLLAGLGLSPSAAAYLGAVDDLSLRYANPDLDGDGAIDLEQGRAYGLDVHVRADLRRGGHNLTVDDLTDHLLADAGPDAPVPVFQLTSAYALYPAALDATTYVTQRGVSTMLDHGAAFRVTQEDGSTPASATSFSELSFGDTRGWGPDYRYDALAGLDLPGSGGSPATLAYTLGASGTTLTFTNVVTRTRASLTEDGSLAIFLRLVTSDGHYTRLDYRWMKRASATAWLPATAEEIALTISSAGGHVSFHRAPAWRNEFGAAIPPEPSGSIAWTWPATGPSDLCSIAVSFDDKLGLRHFIGGADGNAGVTCTD
jgi:hypothetical protein